MFKVVYFNERGDLARVWWEDGVTVFVAKKGRSWHAYYSTGPGIERGRAPNSIAQSSIRAVVVEAKKYAWVKQAKAAND